MIMAPRTFQAFLFLFILVLCQSFMHDESSASSTTSSPSSAVEHRHRHHHNRHHHSNGQQPRRDKPIRKEDVKDDDTAPGRGQSQGNEQARLAGEGKHNAQLEVMETPPARDGRTSKTAVPKTTQPTVRPAGASAKEGDESRLGPEHADPPPQSSDLMEHKIGRPEQRAVGSQLTTMPSSPSPEPASVSSTPSLGSQQKRVTDRQDVLQPVFDKKSPDTTTPTNGRNLSADPPNNDDDDVKAIIQDSAFLESSAESSDDKLVNRPRWRHIQRQNGEHNNEDEPKTNPGRLRIKANGSRNRPKDIKGMLPEREAESAPPLNQQSPQSSGPPPHPHPGSRHRFKNRPRWQLPRETPEVSESSSVPTQVKQKGHGHRDIHGKKGKSEDPSKARKKEKEEIPVQVVQKRKKKSKRRGKKKSKQLPKGCPGCSPTELKLAEARELHKQVLKAQLLDKLRLVPTFSRQPWPPKLPEQVFSQEAQRDEGNYEDRYYARPTQLLLFGRDLGPRHRLKKAGTGSYKFGVRDKVKGGVRWARLWVYKMKDANDLHGQTLVITQLKMSKRRRLREVSLVARLDTHVQEGWVSFDVTQLVRKWVENESPTSLQLLAIRCKTCQRTNYRTIFGVKSHFRPVLEIRESEGQLKQREKRSPCDPTVTCCKFDMTVTFEELGIHEIFRPLAIKADYCYGTCERPDAHHYTHTMIVQHMRFNSHVDNATLRQQLQPCCVPVVLREATIYHYLNSGLDSQVSLVPNLLVDRCGCA